MNQQLDSNKCATAGCGHLEDWHGPTSCKRYALHRDKEDCPCKGFKRRKSK